MLYTPSLQRSENTPVFLSPHCGSLYCQCSCPNADLSEDFTERKSDMKRPHKFRLKALASI